VCRGVQGRENESVSVLCLNAALSAWAMTFSNRMPLTTVSRTIRASPRRASSIGPSGHQSHHICSALLFKATGDLKYRDDALFYAMALDVKGL
jgi:hypothetical protein